jgi:hypothetical protein
MMVALAIALLFAQAAAADSLTPQTVRQSDRQSVSQTDNQPALSQAKDSEPSAPTANPAKTLLKTAYDRRYTWNTDFPGYEAEVAVKYQDTFVQGSALLLPTLEIATKNVADKQIREVILAQLQMAATQLQPVSFADTHGQSDFKLVSQDNDRTVIEETQGQDSARYTIQNQEITQVDRTLGEYALQLKTLDSLKTSEGYLQTRFQATFRNAKTDELVEQDDVRDRYEKVGHYYLLAKREIRRGDGENWASKLYPDTTLRFSNFDLLPPIQQN